MSKTKSTIPIFDAILDPPLAEDLYFVICPREIVSNDGIHYDPRRSITTRKMITN